MAYTTYIFENVIINSPDTITFAYINTNYTEKSGATMPDEFSSAPIVWLNNSRGVNSGGGFVPAHKMSVSAEDVDEFTVSRQWKSNSAVNNYYDLEIKVET